MGDEEINDALGGSAHTEQPSIVGILTTDVLEDWHSGLKMASKGPRNGSLGPANTSKRLLKPY